MAKTNQEEQRKAPILRFKGFTNDWEQRKLNEIANIYDGIHETPNYKSYGIPFVSVENIKDLKTKKYVSNKFYKEKYKIKPSKNDILMTRIGDVGTSNIVTKTPLAYYVSLALIKFDNSQNPVFFKFMFDTNFIQKEIWSKTLHIAFPKKINKNEIGKINIFITDNSEEKCIALILKKLEYILSLYVKKSKHIDSYMSYFINVFYNDTEILCKKNHPKMKLKLHEVLIKNKLKNKDLSVSNVESISNKKGFVSQKKQFDNYQVASKDLSNYYVIRPKYFAYNPSRINVGSIAYKEDNEEKSIVSPLYVSFKCNNDLILDKYLWYWFKSSCFNKQRLKLSEGGVRDTLSFNQLSEMIILLPSIEIQEQIINLFDVLSTYKEEIDNKILNLKKIKKELLNDMFL